MVARRERVGGVGSGDCRTAVTITTTLLVEVPDDVTGEALDIFVVPAEMLEIRPRSPDSADIPQGSL